MQAEKYKALATEICDLFAEGYTAPNGKMEPYEPAEFQAGLTFALALYFRAMFPTEMEEVWRMHCESIRVFMEELDAKGHKDDVVELAPGVKL